MSADLSKFVENVESGKKTAGSMEDKLGALASAADVAEHALNQVKLTARAASESDTSTSAIIAGVRGISDESKAAAAEIDRVKLTAAQAAESKLAADGISEGLNQVSRNADQAKRKLTEVKLAGDAAGAGGLTPIGVLSSGAGGSGGGVGLLGSTVGAGVLAAPAVAPSALAVLTALPALLAGAAGAAGTLELAFHGVGAAIGGDKKAFDALGPSAQQFVETVRSLDGWLHTLEHTAQDALLPALTTALHSALSSGTVAAITTAVKEFATVLGQAGEEWGKYFGSSEFQSVFGPVMAGAARNLGVVSDAALKLADGVGVLTRAGLPLDNWMADGIRKAAQLADSWLHAQDASGGLAHAMSNAQTSIRQVGALLEALGRVVGALGQALYPVSKIFLTDLTNGLNALAKIIRDNQGEIQSIVSGALSAFVDIIKTAYPIVATLAHDADLVVHAIGGWKPVFEVLIGLKLATVIAGWATAVGKLGAASVVAGEEVGDLRAALIGLGAPEVLAALAASYGGYKLIQNMTKGTTEALASYGPQLKAGESIANVQNDIAYLKSVGDTYSQQYLALVQLEKLMKQSGSVISTAAQVAAAQKAAAVALSGDSAITGGAGQHAALKTRGGTYSQRDVYQLLVANGVPKDVATNLAIISAHGEDPSGKIDALNNNPSTGDYSIGLFQENFLGQMGVDRVKQYAPMFGLSPNMSVPAFVKWLGEHPSAQAQIAYSIYQGSGYGAWTTAAGLGITGGSSTTSAFGGQPPWPTTGKPKAPPVIPAQVTDLLDRASTNANKAKNLGNAGGTAARYLTDELDDLETARAELEKKLATAKGKDRTTIENKITAISNKMRDVQTQISNSLLVIGDALIPKAPRARMTQLQSKFQADSDYAAVLTGDAADEYQKVILGNLQQQRATLAAEIATVKRRMASDSPQQRQKDKQELEQLNQQLSSVNDQVLQSLQSTVQSLQSKESSLFSSVTSEFDAQFEAQTQSMIDQLGVKFFQNGLQTPLEQQLAAMQAQDQLQSLKDAVASATDAKSKAAAERQLDEYNLSIRATAERTKADQDYANAVKQLQAQRTKLEDQMNKKLATLGDALENGTGNIADLSAIAAEYGIQITTDTIPDFADLSTATSDLVAAFAKLDAYIAKLTGTSPDKIPSAPRASLANIPSLSQFGWTPLPQGQGGHTTGLAGVALASIRPARQGRRRRRSPVWLRRRPCNASRCR